jgi:pyruvate formate lyase activating enzyme
MGIDGKGVTALVAGAGCPLRCRWCINKKLLAENGGTPVTAEELNEKVKRDDLYFRATGGGVTFGGGESLLHTDFYERFREVCSPEWKLCAETSLSVPRKNLEKAVFYCLLKVY